MTPVLFAFQLAVPAPNAALSAHARRLAWRPNPEGADAANAANRALYETLRSQLPRARGAWRWVVDPVAAAATWNGLSVPSRPPIPAPGPDEPAWVVVTFAALGTGGSSNARMLAALTDVDPGDAGSQATFDRFLRELHKLDARQLLGFAWFVRPRDAEASAAGEAELAAQPLAPLAPLLP